MKEYMKTKKIFILPTILIRIHCISTVPVKVTGIKVKQHNTGMLKVRIYQRNYI